MHRIDRLECGRTSVTVHVDPREVPVVMAPHPDPAGSPGDSGIVTEVKLLAVTVVESLTYKRAQPGRQEMTPKTWTVCRARRHVAFVARATEGLVFGG
jgi:hypothetical protein